MSVNGVKYLKQKRARGSGSPQANIVEILDIASLRHLVGHAPQAHTPVTMMNRRATGDFLPAQWCQILAVKGFHVSLLTHSLHL